MASNFSMAEWVNVIETGFLGVVALQTFRFNRRVESDKKPKLDASANAWDHAIHATSLTTTLHLSLLNTGGSTCWINEIVWKDSENQARDIDAPDFDRIKFPIKVESGQAIEYMWTSTVGTFTPEDIERFGPEVSLRQLVKNGIVDDFTTWDVAIRTNEKKPLFVNVFNGDFRSAKAYATFDPRFFADGSEYPQTWWPGLVGVPRRLWDMIRNPSDEQKKLAYFIWTGCKKPEPYYENESALGDFSDDPEPSPELPGTPS